MRQWRVPAEDADTELLRKHVEQLGEHFDAVTILCTRHEPETEDGTIQISDGCGNWFARYGQIREWIVRAEERTRRHIRDE